VREKQDQLEVAGERSRSAQLLIHTLLSQSDQDMMRPIIIDAIYALNQHDAFPQICVLKAEFIRLLNTRYSERTLTPDAEKKFSDALFVIQMFNENRFHPRGVYIFHDLASMGLYNSRLMSFTRRFIVQYGVHFPIALHEKSPGHCNLSYSQYCQFLGIEPFDIPAHQQNREMQLLAEIEQLRNRVEALRRPAENQPPTLPSYNQTIFGDRTRSTIPEMDRVRWTTSLLPEL